MTRSVGKNIPRQDGRDKATGAGKFTHDITWPNMLHAKVLRSPHAHAWISSIDISEALPGVEAVATCKNTTRRLFNTSATMMTTLRPEKPVLDQQIFPDIVRYVGDEVAAVAADTEEIAAEALKRIKVEYDILPAVFDPLEARKDDAPTIHGEGEYKNICGKPIKCRERRSGRSFPGAKGIGECGVIPTAPAILSAVEDAVGIRFYEIPLTPGRVLAKINERYGYAGKVAGEKVASTAI